MRGPDHGARCLLAEAVLVWRRGWGRAVDIGERATAAQSRRVRASRASCATRPLERLVASAMRS
jgi:hypothetical protein